MGERLEQLDGIHQLPEEFLAQRHALIDGRFSQSGCEVNAVILFAHGARDPRWADPLRAIAQEILRVAPMTQVELAFLEMMEPTLGAVVAKLHQAGVGGARLVPVFLGGAGHVLRDLPELVEASRAEFPGFHLSVSKAVGQDPRVIAAIANVALDIP